MTGDKSQDGAGSPPAPEELPTAREESGEPGGDENASNEAERIPEDAPGGSPAAVDEDREVDLAEDTAAEPPPPADPVERAELERDEYLRLAQRTQADFENYRKRAVKEAAAAGERARGGLVRELLPVVDNLERALASAADGEQHLAEGVRLVYSELLGVLERNGVEQFDPRGEQFNPEVHEALSTRSEEGADSGIVLDTVEKGYRLNEAVLRPARVVVSG